MLITSPAVKLVSGKYPVNTHKDVDESGRSTELVVNKRVEFKETFAYTRNVGSGLGSGGYTPEYSPIWALHIPPRKNETPGSYEYGTAWREVGAPPVGTVMSGVVTE